VRRVRLRFIEFRAGLAAHRASVPDPSASPEARRPRAFSRPTARWRPTIPAAIMHPLTVVGDVIFETRIGQWGIVLLSGILAGVIGRAYLGSIDTIFMLIVAIVISGLLASAGPPTPLLDIAHIVRSVVSWSPAHGGPKKSPTRETSNTDRPEDVPPVGR
jgi:hypothetical protein